MASSQGSRVSEGDSEAFVLMESTAPADEVEAVRTVLREAGLDLPVEPRLERRAVAELGWLLLIVLPILRFGWSFLDQFARRLGERAGDVAADSLGEFMKRLRRARRGQADRMEIEDSTTRTRFVLTDDLSDDAYRAIREVDLERPDISGNVLIFDQDRGEWLPVL